jgi:hypothetical protein
MNVIGKEFTEVAVAAVPTAAAFFQEEDKYNWN